MGLCQNTSGKVTAVTIGKSSDTAKHSWNTPRVVMLIEERKMQEIGMQLKPAIYQQVD